MLIVALDIFWEIPPLFLHFHLNSLCRHHNFDKLFYYLFIFFIFLRNHFISFDFIWLFCRKVKEGKRRKKNKNEKMQLKKYIFVARAWLVPATKLQQGTSAMQLDFDTFLDSIFLSFLFLQAYQYKGHLITSKIYQRQLEKWIQWTRNGHHKPTKNLASSKPLFLGYVFCFV